jgi:hypothetical protein
LEQSPLSKKEAALLKIALIRELRSHAWKYPPWKGEKYEASDLATVTDKGVERHSIEEKTDITTCVEAMRAYGGKRRYSERCIRWVWMRA